jgi:hypothetical protein
MNMEQLMQWKLEEETEVLGEKHAPVPLCRPQIPQDLTEARTWATTVGHGPLTAQAIAGTSFVYRSSNIPFFSRIKIQNSVIQFSSIHFTCSSQLFLQSDILFVILLIRNSVKISSLPFWSRRTNSCYRYQNIYFSSFDFCFIFCYSSEFWYSVLQNFGHP